MLLSLSLVAALLAVSPKAVSDSEVLCVVKGVAPQDLEANELILRDSLEAMAKRMDLVAHGPLLLGLIPTTPEMWEKCDTDAATSSYFSATFENVDLDYDRGDDGGFDAPILLEELIKRNHDLFIDAQLFVLGRGWGTYDNGDQEHDHDTKKKRTKELNLIGLGLGLFSFAIIHSVVSILLKNGCPKKKNYLEVTADTAKLLEQKKAQV